MIIFRHSRHCEGTPSVIARVLPKQSRIVAGLLREYPRNDGAPLCNDGNNGFTLVELAVFIVIMSILSMGILTAMNTGAKHSPEVTNETQSAFLAQQRMEAIIAYKRSVGFSSLVDPCAASIYPAALCTVSGFTVSSTITPSFNGNANLSNVLVTVVGSPATYTFNTVIGNFE